MSKSGVRLRKMLLAECRLPLPEPIRLGAVSIVTRDYVALRLEANDGSFGDAIGYPRGTPLLETLARLAPDLVDLDIHERRGALERMLGARVNARPAFIRAASLIDIALADLASKAAGLSWSRMTGAVRDRVPMMAVAGYYLDRRGIDDVVEEVRQLLDDGYARVKIMLNGADAAFDQRYVTACSAIAGDRLAVDAHWSWRAVDEARAHLKPLDDLRLAFIEDPFGAYLNRNLGPLQQLLDTPLAAGEDMPDAPSLMTLTEGISVLRVDATTCGGLTDAYSVSEAAGLRGATVLPHVFMPIHAQLAGACRAVKMVEHIPESSGADPMQRLLRRRPHIESGLLHIDETPGAGIEFEWEAVASATTVGQEIELIN